jgi:hypothetical protein
MAAAVVQMQVLHGWEGAPDYASAESGLVINRADNELTVKRLPIPDTAPRSNYSNYKALRLAVVTPGDTTLTNLSIRKATVEDAGLAWFRGAAGAYVQCTGDGDSFQGNRPADNTSALAASPVPNTPASYAPIATTYYIWDTGSYDASIAGPFGDTLPVLAGVSSAYGGAATSGRPLPTLYYRYSET